MSARYAEDARDLFDQVGAVADRLVPEHGPMETACAFLAVALAVALDGSDQEREEFFCLLAGALPMARPC